MVSIPKATSRVSSPAPLDAGARRALSGHSPANTKADIEKALCCARNDVEVSMLHDFKYDVTVDHKSLTRAQRLFLDKMLARADRVEDLPRYGPDGLPLNRKAHEETYGQPTLSEGSECNYDGCLWRGSLGQWWDHAHEEHGRELPHFMKPPGDKT